MRGPFGKQIPNPARAVVLIIDQDGLQHGWEVFNGKASYEITGYPSGSAHGTISVSGEFHRMARMGLDLPEIEPTRGELTG